MGDNVLLVNATVGAGSAITAALILLSRGRVLGTSPLRTLLAKARVVFAVRCSSLEIETSTCEHQPCVAALRKAEEPNLGWVDCVSVLPIIQHKIDKVNDIGRPRGPTRQCLALRGIVAVVTRMTDGCNDKAGISQRLCGVTMETEPAAATVGEDNQRQLRASERTIFHTVKRIGKGHREAAKPHALRLRCAWIPNSACERWSVEQLDASAPRRVCQTTN